MEFARILVDKDCKLDESLRTLKENSNVESQLVEEKLSNPDFDHLY
jgi:hypothetical protein